MIKQYHKFKDRRHKSFIKPLLYLLMELALFIGLCWIIFQFDSLLLNVLTVVGSIYFFITSSWKRYLNVRARQKYYEE